MNISDSPVTLLIQPKFSQSRPLLSFPIHTVITPSLHDLALPPSPAVPPHHLVDSSQTKALVIP